MLVDRTRGEKLVVNLDITFPRVPCYRECFRDLLLLVPLLGLVTLTRTIAAPDSPER